jgi:hypothetical protein
VGNTVEISMLLLDNIIIEIPSLKVMLRENSKNEEWNFLLLKYDLWFMTTHSTSTITKDSEELAAFVFRVI